MTKGGRNLIIMGVAACLIAIVVTGISLAIYHNSGDIYLDRSRPGYLPDTEEIKQEEEGKKEEEYNFSNTGKITAEVLEEYLQKLEKEVEALDSYSTSFGAEPLSDEQLGIPE